MESAPTPAAGAAPVDYRALPSVASLVDDPRLRAATSLGQEALTRAVQGALAEERAAIARGEERSLTRCTPGGRETAKKPKELAAQSAG